MLRCVDRVCCGASEGRRGEEDGGRSPERTEAGEGSELAALERRNAELLRELQLLRQLQSEEVVHAV